VRSFFERLSARYIGTVLVGAGQAVTRAGACRLAAGPQRHFVSFRSNGRRNRARHLQTQAGGVERADQLTSWLDALIAQGEERIVPFDAHVGRIAGALSEKATASGRHPGFADVAIAATALARGLVVLTCNGKHFEPLGVNYVDPTEGLPD